MNDTKIIDLTPDTISAYGVCGYKDVEKHVELQNKIQWFKKYYPKGLRIKALISQTGGYQGMLEYIPGRYAHRPVEAKGYMFIQCIFVGFKKEFKGKGYASMLLDECINDAKQKNMLGVCVVTRKGSFMAKKDLFLKKGFQIVESMKPDFDLLVKKFDETAKNPSFKPTLSESLKKYEKGLFILRSPQCPYTEKNVQAIMHAAKNTFNLQTTLVDLKDAHAVQNTPCAFGTFCIIYNGEIISHHPISKARFENIMNKRNTQNSMSGKK